MPCVCVCVWFSGERGRLFLPFLALSPQTYRPDMVGVMHNPVTSPFREAPLHCPHSVPLPITKSLPVLPQPPTRIRNRAGWSSGAA